MRLIVLLALAIAPLVAQTKLEFEVASVRPSGQPEQRCFGKTLEGETVRYGCYSIVAVIMDAYGLPAYQLLDLEKAKDIYVDISARMKPGTTKTEMQQMLQNLLADRFHLRVRRESRQGPVYELSVASGGHKLTERSDNPLPGTAPTAPLKMGADGIPDFPKVAGLITGGFASPGKSRAIGTNVTAADLAEYLVPRLRAPVTDVTGLKGKYDFKLDFVDPSNDASMSATATAGEQFPSLPAALSSQLGLRIEKKTGAVPFLAIEAIDKVPTEN